MRVILDSNILFSALISRYSPPQRIYQAWRRGLMLNNMQGSVVFSQLPPGYETADKNDAWLLALSDKSQAHYKVLN